MQEPVKQRMPGESSTGEKRKAIRNLVTRTGIDYAIVLLPSRRQQATVFAWGIKKDTHRKVCVFFGDPYGNRTHVTAVKGRCLNRLTNGPGSGNLT